MSLIVARKEESKIYIIGDTKLTAPSGQVFNKGQQVSAGEAVIKTTILNTYSCISFAGNIQFAEEVLKSISPGEDSNNVTDKLLANHLESEQVTEYIYSLVGSDGAHIFEIKNGTCQKVESAWIGSQPAFARFQSYMLGEGKKHRKQNFMTITNADAGDLLLRMTEAMDGVIEDEDLPEVAGFKIKVYFDGHRFVYEGYLDTYFTAEQLHFNLAPGSMMPITHANAAQGGYTINFFNSRDNYNYVGLHVKQGNFGILFERKDGGLLYPRLLENTDEIDFLDAVKPNYQIWPSGVTQSAAEKFGILGKQCANHNNYSDAIKVYERGLNHVSGIEKATFYFNIAICKIHLNNIPDAVDNFNEAVKLDPNRQPEATKIMQSVFGRR